MANNHPLHRVFTWARLGGLAIADQAAFSGANFLMNLLLARWFGPSEYGVFALAFSVYLLGSGLHNSLILEPITVFGTGKYSAGLRQYLMAQVPIHFMVTIGLAGVVITANAMLGAAHILAGPISQQLYWVAIFLPLTLLMWLARRSAYVIGRPGWALAGSGAYAMALLGLLVLLRPGIVEHGAEHVYGLMGVSSVLGAAIVYALLGKDAAPRFGTARDVSELLFEQWRFGRWLIVATVLSFAATQAQLFMAAVLLGLQGAGTFSAIQNFMLPMMQMVAVISTLGLPVVARDRGQGEFRKMQSKSFAFSRSLLMIALLYSTILWLFSRQLEAAVYSGRYAAYAPLIPLVSLVPVLAALRSGFELAVRALRRPTYFLIYGTVSAAVGLGLGWPLVQHFQVAGAVVSLVLASLVSLIVAIRCYQIWFSSELLSPNPTIP